MRHKPKTLQQIIVAEQKSAKKREVHTSLLLSVRAVAQAEALQKHLGLSRSGVMRVALAKLALAEGIFIDGEDEDER